MGRGLLFEFASSAKLNRSEKSMRAANSAKAEYSLQMEGGQVVCELSGRWAAGVKLPAGTKVAEEASAMAKGKGDQPGIVCFSAKGLTEWDSGLIAFLFQAVGQLEAKGYKADTQKLPEQVVSLLHLALAVPEKEGARGEKERPTLFEKVGRYGFHFWEEVVTGVTFIGECTVALFRLATGKARLRKRDFWQIVQEVGATALPIVALISFLVGLIIAFLGAVVLIKFGADYYVSYLVGYGMLREMGAVMAGIIMAGRTGAAFAAQIGSMKVSEELDALVTFGLSPTEFLVIPRIIALSLMMPLLTVYADVIGILSGMLVSGLMLDIPPEQFWNGLNYAVGGKDFLLGVFKGGVFGVIIAASGCLRGMQCGNSADAVGMAATSAVVTGITGIIFANAVIDWIAALFGF